MVLRIISKDQEAARYTEQVSGFVWDSAETTVSDLRVLTRTSTILRLSATVTDEYHIHNAPATSQPRNYSGATDPYEFTFTRQPARPWRLAQIRHLGPTV
jgi:hypothetical protein